MATKEHKEHKEREVNIAPSLCSLRSFVANPLSPGQLAFRWLGQAGFWIRTHRASLVIDPYLSDSLAAKYAGKAFPHDRMMPPPVPAGEIEADCVLCTHRHSDHMDAQTLAAIMKANPACRVLVPRAEETHALSLGLPAERLVTANDGECIRLTEDIQLHVVAAAHETLRTNAAGQHHYLGYIMELEGVALYHSGDCVPYDGLVQRLSPRRIDVALLPVNGRRAELSSQGIAGNFTFEEAVELCLALGIPTLVPHHWGMFAFNTVAREDLERSIARADPRLRVLLPETTSAWKLAPR